MGSRYYIDLAVILVNAGRVRASGQSMAMQHLVFLVMRHRVSGIGTSAAYGY